MCLSFCFFPVYAKALSGWRPELDSDSPHSVAWPDYLHHLHGGTTACPYWLIVTFYFFNDKVWLWPGDAGAGREHWHFRSLIVAMKLMLLPVSRDVSRTNGQTWLWNEKSLLLQRRQLFQQDSSSEHLHVWGRVVLNMDNLHYIHIMLHYFISYHV